MIRVFYITLALVSVLFGILIPSTVVAQEGIPSEVHSHVLEVHNQYFQLCENGAYEAAYKLLTERQKANVSQTSFSNHWTTIRESFGRLTYLNNRKVTWYRNLDGLPEGLYVAIDFRASFENLPIYCGYIVWSVDEGYKIQREDMRFMEDKTGDTMSDEDKEEAYQNLSCR